MPDWLLSRQTVIALAIVGGVLSVLASWGKSQGFLSAQPAYWINKTAYAFMLMSIVLFISVGFFGAGG